MGIANAPFLGETLKRSALITPLSLSARAAVRISPELLLLTIKDFRHLHG